MTGQPLRVVALSAGLRAPSSTRALSDALVHAVTEHLVRMGVASTVRTIEVRDHAVDATSAMLGGERCAALAEAVDVVEHADVLVVATPIYNGSYTGLFKTFTDLVPMDALIGTPVVLGATGGSARHTLAVDQELRPLFTVLQATTVPTGVFAASADWLVPGVPGEALEARIVRAGAEAAALALVRPPVAVG